jgi:hypothetical protein
MGARERLDIHGVEIRRPQLEHLRPQEKHAPRAHDVAELLERVQAATRGGGGQPGVARDLAQGERGVLAVERADHAQALGQTGHDLATWQGLFSGRHTAVYFAIRKRQRPRRQAP